MKILVTGSGSGLGRLIAEALDVAGHDVIQYDREHGNDVVSPRSDLPELVRKLQPEGKALDVLINCAGINRIGWLQQFPEEDWDDVMDTNAKGIFMMTKALLPHLIESKGTVLNIVSNASHMPMTCSAAYNASKGAAHILTLQLARELTKKYGITVFGISPNKLHGTGMSDDIDRQVCDTRGWSPEEARRYQLNSLLWTEETDPRDLAKFVSFLMEQRHHRRWFSGTIIPYGA